MTRFEKNVAVVTGSSRNIGKSVASAFAREGAAVVLNAAESGDELENTSKELMVRGFSVHPVLADLSNPEGADRLVREAIDAYGRIDVLVICHSIRPVKSFEKLSVEEWHRVLDVNLSSKFYLLQSALPEMVKTGGGSMVVVGGGGSTPVGPMASRGRAHLNAPLAGSVALLHSLQREYAWKGIRINYVSPGITNTVRKHPEWYPGSPTGGPQVDPELIKTIPLGRAGEPEEIANAVLWLASREASYVIGTTIAVNGGSP